MGCMLGAACLLSYLSKSPVPLLLGWMEEDSGGLMDQVLGWCSIVLGSGGGAKGSSGGRAHPAGSQGANYITDVKGICPARTFWNPLLWKKVNLVCP